MTLENRFLRRNPFPSNDAQVESLPVDFVPSGLQRQERRVTKKLKGAGKLRVE
jgi:hypothetical protein